MTISPSSTSLTPNLSDTDKTKFDDPRFVTALSRGLLILACFNPHQLSLTHQQIHEQTRLPKATISRLLFTLVALGYLTQDDKGNYQLGTAALRLAQAAGVQYDINRLTSDLLQAFAERYHVSVNIAKAQGSMMRYVACYRSPARLSVNLQVGSQVPIEQTAIGRAYFVNASPTEQQTLLASIRQRLTVNAANQSAFDSIATMLQTQQDYYTRQHYTLSDGDYQEDILAIAVAIPRLTTDVANNTGLANSQGHSQESGYVLNASVPRSQWQLDEFISTLLVPLQQLAQQLAVRLSGA